MRDLGYLGVDMGSLRGFYSDSLTESAMTASCSDRQYTTETACTVAVEMWTAATQGFDLPCRTSAQTVARDAVHVALAANWQDAGWAAAQVWRDGLPMAAESMGRMSQRDPRCGGSGLWRTTECCLTARVGRCGRERSAAPDSRKLAQSVGRTPLSG